MSTLRQAYFTLSPDALAGLVQTKQALAQSPLGAALIELVYLRVSQINGCSYCLEMHNAALRGRDVPQAKLDALAGWHASQRFSERERAALQWAESLTLLPVSHAADADYTPLTAHFSAKEISDLTFAIALMNAFNRMAVGMRQ
ncbi:MAG: carboxymuconolactone decarboxylase family protein [Paludibacterium sp.]|uniref:carboxymuconolactone decarboxylase family protein n=1 Tax=Paludibacterium sp. TaxID=1917523 RepID=UPI0025EAB7E8|nr:carboxymuconolactone decarboxylase family protein [Paludibacterium sp.]MBV8046163.1 carboxymuconolactone decarboxylase family protein [Paludibacterium sp.]